MFAKYSDNVFCSGDVLIVEDHILSSLHPSVSLADFVKDVKTGSALRIKWNSVFKRFSHWQEGYAAFTCSQRDIDDWIESIQGQEEPHRKTPSEEEYRNLLVEAGIEFDERYRLSAHCPAPFGAVTLFFADSFP